MSKWIFALALFLATPAVAQECDWNVYRAVVTSVHDGDAVTVDVALGFDVHLDDQRIRLAGIDAPELRGEERLFGIIARTALWARVVGQEVILTVHGRGKYGRWLGRVYLGEENVNEWLVAAGFARRYR